MIVLHFEESIKTRIMPVHYPCVLTVISHMIKKIHSLLYRAEMKIHSEMFRPCCCATSRMVSSLALDSSMISRKDIFFFSIATINSVVFTAIPSARPSARPCARPSERPAIRPSSRRSFSASSSVYSLCSAYLSPHHIHCIQSDTAHRMNPPLIELF